MGVGGFSFISFTSSDSQLAERLSETENLFSFPSPENQAVFHGLDWLFYQIQTQNCVI